MRLLTSYAAERESHPVWDIAVIDADILADADPERIARMRPALYVSNDGKRFRIPAGSGDTRLSDSPVAPVTK